MTPTSVTLLGRLQTPSAEPDDWTRFHAIYEPLIRRYIGKIPGCHADVEDVTQEVLAKVIEILPDFHRQRDGWFRKWLRVMTVHRVSEHLRKRDRLPLVGIGSETDDFLAQFADERSELTQRWNSEHDLHVLKVLHTTLRSEFREESTWKAYLATVMQQRSVAEAAAEIGISENAVMKAKSRVLRRLRELAEGFVDDI